MLYSKTYDLAASLDFLSMGVMSTLWSSVNSLQSSSPTLG